MEVELQNMATQPPGFLFATPGKSKWVNSFVHRHHFCSANCPLVRCVAAPFFLLVLIAYEWNFVTLFDGWRILRANEISFLASSSNILFLAYWLFLILFLFIFLFLPPQQQQLEWWKDATWCCCPRRRLIQWSFCRLGFGTQWTSAFPSWWSVPGLSLPVFPFRIHLPR